ncbi:hypothetical protein [Glaesserella parasuis]|uniref:hypothetical protein n=1 Tax=Glaesserella parasuis TaxID=738 RepID=UPI00132AA45F|nr:hypothetical protein [Glaesserella parasuis]MDG6479960.1 hypothetical protein [Glaesserella parasuis]MDP0298084.1 hypothetical protein [Glaesserella parasuis]MWQ82388.1 hypothetical protein [Glaesserella parasuis]
MNKELNWNNFSEAELKAISIHTKNVQEGTNSPTFPFSAAVFEELAELLSGVAMMKPNSALTMVDELDAINKVLLRISPTPQTKDIEELTKLYTDEEIQQNLLACNVCHFLVQQFLNMKRQMITALEAVKEMEELGGTNATKH